VSPGGDLYAPSGRRAIGPPIRFGIGVLWHLLRHGRRYDAVHTASFPYFSLLGARLALWLRRSRAPLVVDWHEVWGLEYWTSYLGRLAGRIGYLVQLLCVRLPDRSFTFSRLHAERLAAEGHRAPITRLTGEYMGQADGARPAEPLETVAPLVLFAGRHIPEKRVPTIPPAIAVARRSRPELRCLILGEGPDTQETRRLAAELGLAEAIELPGRAPSEVVASSLAGAACMLLPSEREGYGLVVVEAIAVDTPVVVVAGPENAATELIEPGVNGLIAASTEPGELAGAILRVIDAGIEMRRSTRSWYDAHRGELSIESSLGAVLDAYRSDSASS
jgi:glycosyltransferase involved in cell wall biosynthesis